MCICFVKNKKHKLLCSKQPSITTMDYYSQKAEQFGLDFINKDLLTKFKTITNKEPHYFLRRNIFFAHKDLDKLLNHVEKGNDIYVYTGRGPSSPSMHFGHLIPFMFTKWLQETFNCKVVIQLTDDEKSIFRDLSLEQTSQYALENAKDIMSLGFDPEKTFIFRNTDYIKELYPTTLKIQKLVKISEVKSLFGFEDKDPIGYTSFPATQMAPCFPICFEEFLKHLKNPLCIVPCAIDQAPYFQLTRNIASRLKFPKPVMFYAKYFPSLSGSQKMSSTNDTPIFLNDTEKTIKKKVMSAFSGGREYNEHLLNGADIDKDVCYQWLSFFEESDEELLKIKHLYSETLSETEKRMSSSEIKIILFNKLLSIKNNMKRV